MSQLELRHEARKGGYEAIDVEPVDLPMFDQPKARRRRSLGVCAQRLVAGLVDFGDADARVAREGVQPYRREVVLQRRRAQLDRRDRPRAPAPLQQMREIAPVAAL